MCRVISVQRETCPGRDICFLTSPLTFGLQQRLVNYAEGGPAWDPREPVFLQSGMNCPHT